MNPPSSLRLLLTVLFAGVLCVSMSAQELQNRGSGAEMMEELVRLTMVPLADEPMDFLGHLAFELEANGQHSVGELRWSPHHDALMWTDAFDGQGDYTVKKDSEAPLAMISMKRNEGAFMSPQMMTLAGYWTDEPPAAPRPLKVDKKSEATPFMGHSCVAYGGKQDKERVRVWVAEADALDMSSTQLKAYRMAFSGWMDSQKSPVLRNVDVPQGLPLALEWGTPGDKGALPNVMEVVTLNVAATFSLDAPQVWMQVPGRDINQVAKEMKEKAEAGE